MALALLFLFGQLGSGLFPDSPSSEDDLAMQERVERLLERRIDINRASARELLVIPWLNPVLAYRIVAMRDSVGAFANPEQVRQVPGMTAGAFEAIRPFLRIGSPDPLWNGSMVSEAATDSLRAGTIGLRTLNRLELQSKGVRAVVLTEKDKGESNEFDFLSAGAELDVSRTRVTLGDFTAGFGQGLVFSAPHWRSSLLDGTDRAGRNVRLVSSAVEGSYLRGGSVEAMSGRWDACALVSYAGRDARLNEDGTVERLSGSGLHDDSASMAGRNAVKEATAGFGAEYRGSRIATGFTAEYLSTAATSHRPTLATPLSGEIYSQPE